MPLLKNLKHERFAQALFKGKSQIEAYTLAGFKPDDGHAARLAGNGRIQARIAELQGFLAKSAITTVETIVAELEEARLAAHADRQHSASVAAAVGKAKLLGLIIDRRETGDPGAFDSMTDEELAARLQKKLSGNVVKLRVNEK